MEQCYIVDAARMPWKRSSIGGLTFKGQVLLSGHDGGPEALRFSFDDCPSMYAHMHLTSQFQLLLHGAMDFPRGVKHLEALAIHYTDHNMTPNGRTKNSTNNSSAGASSQAIGEGREATAMRRCETPSACAERSMQSTTSG